MVALWSVKGDDQAVPVQPALSRYEHIWKSLPFVVASEVAPPQASSIAQRYVLSAYARIGNNDVIFLLDRKRLTRFSISRAAGQNGVELLDVVPANNVKQVRAKIRANGEVTEISYDDSVAATNPTGVSAPMIPPNPGAMPTVAGLTIPRITNTNAQQSRPVIIRRRPLVTQ